MEEVGKRTCGKCTACCKTHAIPKINKPEGKWCGNCKIGKGCIIYLTRPKECKDFRCEWLKGFGRKDTRPDLIKIVLDYQTNGLLKKLFTLWEVSKKALSSPFAKNMINFSLINKIPVCLIYCNGKKELFIPENLRLLKKVLKQLKQENIKLFVTKKAPR